MKLVNQIKKEERNLIIIIYKYSFFSGRLFQAAMRTSPPASAVIIQNRKADSGAVFPIRTSEKNIVIAEPT